MFRDIYEMLNSDQLFNKGMEIEVLKGFNQHIPSHRLDKRCYRRIRLSGYNKKKI